MDIIIGIIIGGIFILTLKDKPIRIEITHKQKENNIVPVPDMGDVLHSKKDAEDEIYASMGSMIDAVNDLMNGGGADGKE